MFGRLIDANSIAIAIKRLSGAREEPREELQAEAINFAQEVYDPSQAQRELSAEHVNSIAESISYDDMSKYEYGLTGFFYNKLKRQIALPHYLTHTYTDNEKAWLLYQITSAPAS